MGALGSNPYFWAEGTKVVSDTRPLGYKVENNRPPYIIATCISREIAHSVAEALNQAAKVGAR